MQELAGKIALVTGAGRGIGRAVAEVLAQHGAAVALTARTPSELEEAAEDIRQTGGETVVVAGDLTDEAFVDELFRTIEARFGQLDILVNNAGIAPFGKAEELPVRKFMDGLVLNITAVFACTQQAIRLMKQHGGTGKIINIGSVRSHWTEAGDAGAYNASKYGLRGMTESIARQLHQEKLNIAVGLVSPGVVDTTLTNPKREARENWLKPETVARAVLHAVTAPDHINVFETILFPTTQCPW